MLDLLHWRPWRHLSCSIYYVGSHGGSALGFLHVHEEGMNHDCRFAGVVEFDVRCPFFCVQSKIILRSCCTETRNWNVQFDRVSSHGRFFRNCHCHCHVSFCAIVKQIVIQMDRLRWNKCSGSGTQVGENCVHLH